MANVHGIVQVELGDQVIEIVGVGIEIIAVPGLLRAAMSAAIVRDAAIAI